MTAPATPAPAPALVPPPGLRRVAIYLAARLLPALASMALTLLCIRSMSAEAYGLYSLTLLPAGVVAGLIGGLAGQAMLRYGDELAPAALRHGLVTLPLAASALAGPLVLAYLFATVGISAGAVIAVALIPLVAMMDTRRSRFIAQGRARAVLTMDVVRAVLALGLAAAFFMGWRADAAVPLLAQVISVAACLVLVRRGRAAPGPPAGARRVDRRYVGYGVWFAGWLAVAGILALAERSVVERMAGLTASGRYAAQADVINALFAATGGALASSMMPSYLALGRTPRTQGRRALRRLLRIGLAGTAGAALLCVGLGVALHAAGTGRLAAALIGDVPTALTLGAAAAVWTAAGFVQKPLELHGQTRLTFACAAAALLVFGATATALAREFGPGGVAAAKLFAGVFFVVATLLVERRVRKSGP